MQIREVFDRKRFVFLDGGMGTQLQARGLQPGQKPELAALEMPEVLTAIHTDYANAGADILLANTFGANAKKLTGCGHTVEEVVSASIACARKAAETTGACVALDIGPLGELLVPAGTLAFEDAYNEFAQVIRAGAAAGADLVFLETMTDLYELKAAILAARENCDLPVFTSMSFESRGRTFTGCTVESYAVTAAGLGADAVGINCSLGPKEILPFAQRLCRSVPAGVPVFVKPNAGLPNPDGSYNLDPDEFAAEMKEYAAIGVSMVGGCCGTTPAFIARLHETFSPLTPADKIPIRRSCLCTPVRFVEVDGITVVGERINPTGKSGCSRPCGTATAPTPALRLWPRPRPVRRCSTSMRACPASTRPPRWSSLSRICRPSPTCRCSSTPRIQRPSPVRCASTTASPSSTRSTVSRRRWKRFCRSAKVRRRRRRPGAGQGRYPADSRGPLCDCSTHCRRCQRRRYPE